MAVRADQVAARRQGLLAAMAYRERVLRDLIANAPNPRDGRGWEERHAAYLALRDEIERSIEAMGLEELGLREGRE